MHLAYPPRKASNPPLYFAPRSSKFPVLRRSRVKALALIACAIGALFFIISSISGGKTVIPSGAPPIVIVTVLDQRGSNREYVDNVKENRLEYAKKHGKICIGNPGQE